MKKLIFIISLFFSFCAYSQLGIPQGATFVATSGGSTFAATHTVDFSSSLSSSTLTNFTFSFEVTLNDLKSVANGGTVTNASGFDIVISSTSDGLTSMNYKTSYWNNSTGFIRVDVRGTYTASTTLRIYIASGKASISTDQSAGNPFDSNTGGYWNMGDGTTLNYTDGTTNAIVFSPSSSPTAVAGKLGGAVDFNTVGRMDCDATSLVSSSYTWSMWANNQTSSTGTMMEMGAGNFTDVNGYLRHSTGFVKWTMGFHETPGSNFKDYDYSASGPATSTWIHYAFVKDGASNVIFYINGTAVSTQASTEATATSGSQRFYITTDRFFGGHWNEYADEIRVDKVARSADWILAEYRIINAPGTYISIMYLPFFCFIFRIKRRDEDEEQEEKLAA